MIVLRDKSLPQISKEEFLKILKEKTQQDNDKKAINSCLCLAFDKNERAWKDRKNINVDHENYGPLKNPIRVNKNGIPYLIGYACGDWENEVVYIIYYDGKEFRSYFPIIGNTLVEDEGKYFTLRASQPEEDGNFKYDLDKITKLIDKILK